tara:strand:+ start:490 stop:2784 length:2295 start_codon:yes stop_codon:yes gene_type:complete
VAWNDYRGKTVGFAKVMGEVPFSDGSLAYEIMNFNLNEEGFLESRFRLMPLIPDEWRSADTADQKQPTPFTGGVLAMKHYKWDGEAPELVFLTNDGLYRFIPGARMGDMPTGSGYTTSGSKGLREEYLYSEDSTTRSVVPQAKPYFPPQMEVVGNRIYFTYCDGGGAYVYDGSRVRRFGFSTVPSPPAAIGPAPHLGAWKNGGAFSDGGRIGTLNHTLVDTDEAGDAHTTGGIESGLWYYAVVFEGPDGAYSATSENGGRCEIMHHVVAADSPWDNLGIGFLRRRFWVNSIPRGPSGTVARILLRTMNLHALPTFGRSKTSSGEIASSGARFLARIPNNIASEYMDDIPDGELGVVWDDRRSVPSGIYFMKFFSGSMFVMRTEQHPSRVWWSEQGNINGATPESFLVPHWREVFPETGPITGALPGIIGDKKMLLVFKEGATHYIMGDYPEWGFGTVSTHAGCAGPNLAQAAPDGTIIWYGSGTFWRLGTDGSAVDIGAPLRARLKGVNKTMERFGHSWLNRTTKEMVFALPYKDSRRPDLQFIWDYQNNGWRLRQDVVVDCVEVMGDKVLIGGSWRGIPDYDKTTDDEPLKSVWVYGNGYPNYDPGGDLYSTYTTGWMSFQDFGPSFHDSHHAVEAIFTLEERSGKFATVKTYADWNFDAAISNNLQLELIHPENNDVPVFAPVTTDTAQNASESLFDSPEKFRTRRVYTHRVPIDISSCNTFSLSVTTSAKDSPMSLISIDAFGPATSLPGGRAPAIYEGSK